MKQILLVMLVLASFCTAASACVTKGAITVCTVEDTAQTGEAMFYVTATTTNVDIAVLSVVVVYEAEDGVKYSSTQDIDLLRAPRHIRVRGGAVTFYGVKSSNLSVVTVVERKNGEIQKFVP